MRLHVPLILAGMLAVAGCTSPEDQPQQNAEPAYPDEEMTTPDSPQQEPAGGQVIPDPDEEAMLAIVDGTNAFTLDLYQQVLEQNENLLLSGFSVSSVLSMILPGAEGETAEQMRETLNLPEDRMAMLSGWSGVLRQMQADTDTTTIGNRLFIGDQFEIESSYQQVVQQAFDAGAETLNFAASGQAVNRINGWVADQTDGMIENLLDPGSVDARTRLVLVNTILFLGKWRSPFDEDMTSDADFTTAAGETVSVPMMRQTSRFAYTENDDLQALVLPYGPSDEEDETLPQFAMFVVLPKEGTGLSAVEEQLSPEMTAELMQDASFREVQVHLPRFTFETKYQLKSPLMAMGIQRAFTGDAQLDGMSTAEELYVDAIVHQAIIEVNEEGTRAAAATAGMIRATSIDPEPPPVFRADRPFTFMIVEQETGAMLFAGRVADPR